MSIKLMSTIFQMDFKNSNSKFVLLALADHENDLLEDRCFPSVTHIAKKCSLSKSTVFRALNDLENIGYLKRIHQKSSKGDNLSNLYKISLPFEMKLIRKESVQIKSPSVTVTPPSVSLTPGVVSQCDTNHKSLTLKETSTVDQQAESTAEKFWESYPNKKQGKQPTLQKASKFSKSEFLKLMEGLGRYIKFIENERKRGFNRQYMIATRFINQKCYLDSWEIDKSSSATLTIYDLDVG